jgi:hypothetical protein
MSVAEQKEMINKYFCGRTIRASKVLFCIAKPLLEKGLLEKGDEDPFSSFVSPLGNNQIFYFLFPLSSGTKKGTITPSTQKIITIYLQ